MLQTNTGAPIPFNIVGTDGGLYKTAAQVDGFQIAPAERVEVVVDFTGLAIGTEVFLNNCLMQTDGRSEQSRSHGLHGAQNNSRYNERSRKSNLRQARSLICW